jgi:hypothetical protein
LDLTPKIIDSLRGKKIVNVACGFSHAIAMTGMPSRRRER